MTDVAGQGATPVTEDADYAALPTGAKIGRYEVLSVLGQGGFGITYRARDLQLDREVAIKEYLPVSLAYRKDGSTVLPRSTKVAEDFTWGRDRFIAEGRTMATLHRAPGIVKVFDFLEINGTAYIVMEMLQGDTLEGRLRNCGRMSPQEIDTILWPLLDGLEKVHAAGFLHRDIKPANILLDPTGHPTLIDFGASRAAMAGRTTAMTAIFTPGYAAPEQFTSAKQGPWTDIYGLAATLYHAITGAAPPSAFDRMLDDGYEPIARRAPPGFPPGLLAGIDAGLAVKASDRPQSIAGWRGILSLSPADSTATVKVSAKSAEPDAGTTRVVRPPAPEPRQRAGEPATSDSATAHPTATPASPIKRSNRAILFGGVAVVALMLLGGGYFLLGPKPAPQPPTVAVQDMKVEQLEQILAARRKADAEAAEKRRQEDEARSKKQAEVAARAQANADLEKARVERQKVEQEIADLKAKAEAEARHTEEERQAAEEAKRKAEEDLAALKAAEEEAQRKAAEQADAKHKADAELDKAQAERKKADEEAAAKAAAEADAKAKADEETRKKAEAEAERKAAEAAETALRLGVPDRQRLQVALTSLGFDTHGSDGAFGPRTREMIGAWQKARNLPATGFLNVTQQQALLKEAAPAVAKYDDEQKKAEDEKKKAEEAKKKAEEEAKAKAAATAPPSSAQAPAPQPAQPPVTAPQPQTATAPVTPPATSQNNSSALDGSYEGSLTLSKGGTADIVSIELTVAVGSASGQIKNPKCGVSRIKLTVSPIGQVSGSLKTNLSTLGCDVIEYSASGTAGNGLIRLKLVSPASKGRGSLTKAH